MRKRNIPQSFIDIFLDILDWIGIILQGIKPWMKPLTLYEQSGVVCDGEDVNVSFCPKVINSMTYSFPLGKVNFKQIDPMTFTEFRGH